MKAIIAVVLLVVVGTIALLVMSASPVVAVTPEVKTVGVSTPVAVTVTDPHGVRHVAAYMEQGGARYPLFEENAPSHRLIWNRRQPPRTLTFEAGKNKAPNLKEGKARVVVEAKSDDFRGSTSSTAWDVDVVLAPPRVIADDLQHYINQAGMELVTFTVSGSWNEAGVKVGNHVFRSFPLPGKGPDQRFSMFAYPWDLSADIKPAVYARNLAGTEALGSFWFKLFPKKFRTRDFAIDDALMEKLVMSVDPTGQLAPGPDLLSRFLKINGELRKKNNKQMADL
ncbi:MAG TPA: M23 family peptidase, partial [Bryobacteraceae bacterium]